MREDSAPVFSTEPLLFIQGLLNMLMKLAVLDVSRPSVSCGWRVKQMAVTLANEVYA